MAQGLVLNPEVKLRTDGSRAVLFSLGLPDGQIDDAFRLLSPQQAVILALFDGKRDLSDVKDATAYLFDLEPEEASRVVEAVLSLPVTRELTIGSLIVEASSLDPKTARVYDPREFVVPADSVDRDDHRLHVPCSMLVLPTLRCFTNCRYCYADRDNSHAATEFDLKFFERLLEQAADCGIETINFSGGDVFIRKDAFDLIQCVLSRGMSPAVAAKYPLSRDQVRRLAQLGLPTIQISIDALRPDVIDGLTQVKGYGERILKTMDYLEDYGIRVRTNTVLTPFNVHDAVNLAYYLAKKLNVYRSNFTCYSRSLYRHDDGLFCFS